MPRLAARRGALVDLLAGAPRRAMPERVAPMLASASTYPREEAQYAFEVKWDGIRAVAHLDKGKVRLRSRNVLDITAQYPDLAGLAKPLASRRVVLDGEIVAFDDRGYPSFQELQNRLGVTGGDAAERARETPVVYVAFDVLHLDGHDTMRLPYVERRAILEALQLAGDLCQLSPSVVGEGRALLGLPGLEGIVAKRLDSTYEPGLRSRAWLKIKTQRRQELVVAGWTWGQGGRSGRIGALLLGVYDKRRAKDQKLLYAGSVGTGFTDATLAQLHRTFAPHVRATSPFATPVDKKGVVFIEPRFVAEIEFTEWTRDGRIRHPSFKGLRDDKDPRDVVKEDRDWQERSGAAR